MILLYTQNFEHMSLAEFVRLQNELSNVQLNASDILNMASTQIKGENACADQDVYVCFPTPPGKPRGIKVHGVADAITRQGRFAFGTYLRVKPAVKWIWGIEEATFRDGKPIIKEDEGAEHQWHTSPLSTTVS